MTDVERERKRCADICSGMAIALMISGREEWTEEAREAGRAVAEWLRAEIMAGRAV